VLPATSGEFLKTWPPTHVKQQQLIALLLIFLHRIRLL